MIIYINGRGMNAPELKAYISELEAENEKLRAKVESAERQKAEYKRILKSAAKIVKNLPCDDDNCGECVHNDNGYVCSEYECFEWRYADEALALIGEEGENDA
jgi:hypothetical protein